MSIRQRANSGRRRKPQGAIIGLSNRGDGVRRQAIRCGESFKMTIPVFADATAQSACPYRAISGFVGRVNAVLW